MQSISSQQCQCARVLLEWDQSDLAARCGLHVQTICLFETGKNTPTKRTLEKITSVLMNAGIEFTDGNGVRKRDLFIATYENTEGFRSFMDDVFMTARDEGGEIVLFNAKPRLWHQWLGEEWYKEHSKRMQKIKKNFIFKITTNKDEKLLIASAFAEYRWFSKKVPNDRAFYCYGSKLAFLNFEEDNVRVQVINQPEIAESFRVLFDRAWDSDTIKPK